MSKAWKECSYLALLSHCPQACLSGSFWNQVMSYYHLFAYVYMWNETFLHYQIHLQVWYFYYRCIVSLCNDLATSQLFWSLTLRNQCTPQHLALLSHDGLVLLLFPCHQQGAATFYMSWITFSLSDLHLFLNQSSQLLLSLCYHWADMDFQEMYLRVMT